MKKKISLRKIVYWFIILSLCTLFLAYGCSGCGCGGGGEISGSSSSSNSGPPVPPADRIIVWDAGIKGANGIVPIRTNEVACTPSDNTGASDMASQIQACINAASSNDVVKLPIGTFRIGSTLTIQKSIVLRGAGVTTILKPTGSVYAAIDTGQGTNAVTANIISGYAKGSQTIVVNNAAGFSAGNLVVIDQINDGTLVKPRTECTYCSRNDGTGEGARAMGQANRITNVSGTTITLETPLYYTFSAAYTPQLYRPVLNPTVKAGIENLKIDMSNATDPHSAGVSMATCVECWVKNLDIYNTGDAHINLTNCSYRCIVRDNYLHEGHNYSGGLTYGIRFDYQASHNLIENNIVYRTRHAIVFNTGASGNVIAYNYVRYTMSDDATYMGQALLAHGQFPYMNLFEGNIAENYNADDVGAGASGYNTLFRNHFIISRVETVPNGGRRAIELNQYHKYYNIVGNVLGKPGFNVAINDVCTSGCSSTSCDDWASTVNMQFGCATPTSTENPPSADVGSVTIRHGNYHYSGDAGAGADWDANYQDHTLPTSYYLTSKPSWMGSCPWPAIGPDVTNYVYDIPAKRKYDSMTTLVPGPPVQKDFSTGSYASGCP